MSVYCVMTIQELRSWRALIAVRQTCVISSEGSRKYRDENESFGEHGFTEKEFVEEELEDVERTKEADDSDLESLSFDDDDYG